MSEQRYMEVRAELDPDKSITIRMSVGEVVTTTTFPATLGMSRGGIDDFQTMRDHYGEVLSTAVHNVRLVLEDRITEQFRNELDQMDGTEEGDVA